MQRADCPPSAATPYSDPALKERQDRSTFIADLFRRGPPGRPFLRGEGRRREAAPHPGRPPREQTLRAAAGGRAARRRGPQP
eukprot:8730689-Pyramimonas_sp.AAC.1